MYFSQAQVFRLNSGAIGWKWMIDTGSQTMAKYRHYISTGRITILLVEMASIQAFTWFLPGETCHFWERDLPGVNLVDLPCERICFSRVNVCILPSHSGPGGEWRSKAMLPVFPQTGDCLGVLSVEKQGVFPCCSIALKNQGLGSSWSCEGVKSKGRGHGCKLNASTPPSSEKIYSGGNFAGRNKHLFVACMSFWP